MPTTTKLQLWELRAEFALRLATLYGNEVPAYNTLVDVSREVNEDFIRRNGQDAERLGSVQRVTAERHGAIRVGSHRELAQVARIFAAFGMHPVGFYDLRDASKSSVPVVSTAFRPIDPEELARNPFRVFTSMLAHDDRRFFDEETQQHLETFIGARTLFSDELLELADRTAREGELDQHDAERLLELATSAFKLSAAPVDHDWYFKLEGISAVAADIGGVPSTHINHLTPRVLDIDDLYARMEARGITMIDEIQGPPNWEGPDILLRQTSFRALAEERSFRYADGEVRPGSLRVRFGEVEQRGIALTETGRNLYDRMVAEVDSWLAASPAGTPRAEIAEQVWRRNLPSTEQELALQGLAHFTYRVADPAPAPRTGSASLRNLVETGVLVPEPIVYEDFLPRSAAGIFQSNLTDDGCRDDGQIGTPYDIDRLSDVLGRRIFDPNELYSAQRSASLAEAQRILGITITDIQSNL
ncbi:VOC family protein [Arthrobacter oryzae]|uniref:2-oxoadipate dioxygenase/decarboxylase n=1 Tax=Arthrobacter oryzae TaxID=409290 RepID=UPI002861F133|nr:VOC family protein [Arthrobacter oryzae]MDR6504841.1 putative glyoxalase superfamily metalloenzyme YdcJ [Arthrobacter oryzae]